MADEVVATRTWGIDEVLQSMDKKGISCTDKNIDKAVDLVKRHFVDLLDSYADEVLDELISSGEYEQEVQHET